MAGGAPAEHPALGLTSERVVAHLVPIDYLGAAAFVDPARQADARHRDGH